MIVSVVACAVGGDDSTSGLSGGPGGVSIGSVGPASTGEDDTGPTTGEATGGDSGEDSTDTGGPATAAGPDTGGDVDPTGSEDEGEVSTSGSGDGVDPTGSESTGEVDVGVQPAFGEYSHCLSNAACNVGSCLALGNPVSDGFCAVTCAGAGNPAPCGAAPVGSPLSPTCYGADNAMGGATYICALDCSNDQPCPAQMTCVSVPQAAAAGGGNVDFCT
ncbi:MAG: hypothetical protein JKY37_18990 [Nannocystaceae bacterium]|nr:hypothetical protein [Nannocystaceae bacterium]